MARVKRMSLRKRREIAQRAEEREFQLALTSNADALITTFVLPRLISAASNPTGVIQYPTMTIEKDGSEYFFKMGRYKRVIPFTPICEEVLQEALSLAPAYELIPDGSGGKATFSMVV